MLFKTNTIFRFIACLWMCLIHSKLCAQTTDTCQCRLLYGNWANPILVTYHHDSLVTYHNMLSPKPHVYKMIKDLKRTDTLFNPEDYIIHPHATHLNIRKGDIGKKIGNSFFPEYVNRNIDSGYTQKTFWINEYASSSELFGVRLFYDRPQLINRTRCNCFNYDAPYRYVGAYNHFITNPEQLFGVPFVEFPTQADSNIFIPASSNCDFDLKKTKICYLRGIGVITMEEPFSENKQIAVKYLHNGCKLFLKKTFD